MIHLRIEADDDHVRVEIEQPTSAAGVHIVDRPGTESCPGGFGLRLIEASADDWGLRPGTARTSLVRVQPLAGPPEQVDDPFAQVVADVQLAAPVSLAGRRT